MIQKLEISGVHVNVDEKLQRYVTKKIGKLDSYMSYHARKSAHAEVLLKRKESKGNKASFACEIILHLPHEVLRVEEATLNLYAAVDIVEAKMRYRLKKYNELHDNPKLHQRLIARVKRQAA
jgi:ribosomal subunit interface protein